MAFPARPQSFLLALGTLCFLSQLHLTLGALYKVADMNGKWGVENYFQAGDFLSFSHHTESGEVHEVSRKEYTACHSSNPMKTYKSGNNVAELGGKSAYYFISGDKALCNSGRKLMVVVLASSPGPAASPTPLVKAPPPPPPAAPTASTPAPTKAVPAPSTPIATPPPTTPVATPPPTTPVVAPTSKAPASSTAPSPSVTSSPSSTSAPAPGSSTSSPAPGSLAGPPSPSTPAPTPPSAAPSLPILLTWSIIAITLSTCLTLLA